MPNMLGIARTNYFRVKDIAAFQKAMDKYDVEVFQEPINGVPHFALFDTFNGGAWPSDVEGMGGKLIPVDFPRVVSEHLEVDQIAILMGVSYEGTRSVRGHSLAIDHTGETILVELDDIYAKAHAKWGRPVEKVEY